MGDEYIAEIRNHAATRAKISYQSLTVFLNFVIEPGRVIGCLDSVVIPNHRTVHFFNVLLTKVGTNHAVKSLMTTVQSFNRQPTGSHLFPAPSPMTRRAWERSSNRSRNSTWSPRTPDESSQRERCGSLPPSGSKTWWVTLASLTSP